MAHFMVENEDCMGRVTLPYWRQFGECSDGRIVIGIGQTGEEADQDAAKKIVEREKHLNLPDEERLKKLVAGELLDTDKKEAIRLLAKILLDK